MGSVSSLLFSHSKTSILYQNSSHTSKSEKVMCVTKFKQCLRYFIRQPSDIQTVFLGKWGRACNGKSLTLGDKHQSADFTYGEPHNRLLVDRLCAMPHMHGALLHSLPAT